jgi:HTH-type transcriptional regulator/antitoxin HigA
MHQKLSRAIKYWNHIAPLVKCPKNNKEFNMLVEQLDELLEIVGNDKNHRLIGLVDTLSHVIAAYEAQHFKMTATKGVDALKFLMESHHLTQANLPEVASQGLLSKILNAKRKLNLRQIKLLGKRFQVEPATFINETEGM